MKNSFLLLVIYYWGKQIDGDDMERAGYAWERCEIYIG
jgi:hypothetical protein